LAPGPGELRVVVAQHDSAPLMDWRRWNLSMTVDIFK
jgi:hypothetical protein